MTIQRWKWSIFTPLLCLGSLALLLFLVPEWVAISAFIALAFSGFLAT